MERAAWFGSLTEPQAKLLAHEWSFWGRPAQQPPPGDWRTWLVLAGRGWGKTRTGVEWIRSQVESRRCGRLALVAPTAADARDVIVEGESGILATSPNYNRPVYEPSKRRLTWKNGAIATTYSADEPDRFRGPQHDGAYLDELAAWKYPEAFDLLMMGLRLGENPRAVITTTPRPVRIIRDLLKDPTVVVTRGSTYDNATNLAPAFMDQIIAKYQGTRLGRQELAGELLDDVPGSLWARGNIDDTRVSKAPDLTRIVVAIDPAVTSGEDSDMTGIVVAGRGVDGAFYILDDQSCRLSPDGWARRAVAAYHKWEANLIVGETNNGGEMVGLTIKTVDRGVPFKAVTASRGKRVRAEPIAALYEQRKVHHCGSFPDLEDQMCSFASDAYDGSPDRVDALVWALSELSGRRSMTSA